MNSFKKTIPIVLTFVMVFTGLPIHITNWSGPTHIYAEENVPDAPPNDEISFLAEAELSDAEAVAADKIWLINNFDKINDDHFMDWLKEDLIFPTAGSNGSIITWSSSNTDLINNEGKVNRPAYSGVNTIDVVLTATLSKGTSSDTAIFKVSVVPLPGSLAVQLDWEDLENISNLLTFNGSAAPGITDMSNPHLFSLNHNSKAGSVFTKNKIQLADDLSFSTSFIFDISSMYQGYDEGFTFTLQTASDTALGTGSFNSLGALDSAPSLTVEFDTKRDSGSPAYEYQGSDTEQHLAVYINGDYQNPIAVAPAAISREDGTRDFSANQKLKIWIQYDGTSKKLEVYEKPPFLDSDPVSPVLSTPLDLSEVFRTPEGAIIQDVYAGFTGHGSSSSIYASIYQWSFKNDPFPIEYGLKYSFSDPMYMDASNVSLSTETINHETAFASTITAIIKDSLGNPVPGVPVTFNTDFGVLDSSHAITDANGRAIGTLISQTPGTAQMRATAQGGAYAEAEAYLIMTDEAKLNKDYNELTADRLLNGNRSLDFVRGDLRLPLTGDHGSTITWSVSEETFLTSTGIVTRPTAAQGDQTVTLTAHLSNGTATRNKEFPVKIKIPDADIVALDSEWLKDVKILNGNASWDEIMTDLYMPDTGENGSDIQWTSSLEGVIATDGAVSRPAYSAPPAEVLLTVTISMGEASINKNFSIQVIPEEATDNDMLWEAYSALNIQLKDNIDLNHISTDISLPTIGLHETSVSWASSNENIIATDGTVHQPTFTTGDSLVTLTATLTKGLEDSIEKTFLVTVIAFEPTDQEAVDKTAIWLTADQIRNTNPSLTEVTSNLLLHTDGLYSAQILWESNNSEVIAEDGKVTPPTFSQGEKTVKLTAVIKRGTYSVTNYFDVRVKALASTDLEALSATETWLTMEEIIGENENSNQVEKPLSLPVTGPENTKIQWECIPGTIISVEPGTMGQLARPSFSVGDITVTLVATIGRGVLSLEKSFEVIVKALPLTDEEAVALDYNRIKIEDTLGLNPSPYAVTGDLTFSTTSAYGSVITYQSSVSDAITLRTNEDKSITGVVTRPDYDKSHQTVTVTVTITKGSQEKLKTLEYTILALRDITPPVPVSMIPTNNSIDVAYNTKETIIRFDEEITHPDGSNFYGYLPKYLKITLNGSLMSDDYIVRFVGKDLIISNRSSFMPTGKNQIVIPKSAVKDKSGNLMAEDLTITYTVEERIVRNISIASSVPANGATKVPINTEISASFDTNGLSKGSMFKEIALMDEKNQSIPVLCELKDNKVTVSLKYDRSLEKGKLYLLFVPGAAVQDRFINQNKSELLSFVVTPETVRPTVVSTFPKQNETDVSVLQHIQVNYKEGVFRAGGQVRITDEASQPVEFAVSDIKNFDTSVNLIPIKPLQANTRYTVVLSSDFVKTKIAPHEPSASEYTFSFITGGDKLSIQSMNPTNFAEDVSVNDPIRLAFNHPVKKGPNSHLLEMRNVAGDKVGVSAQYDGNMVGIQPLKWMDPDESYTLILPAGAFSDVDDEGNFNDSLTFTFTTGKNLVLSSGDSFGVNPSSRYYVNKKLTFDTSRLQEIFRRLDRRLVSCEWDFGDWHSTSGLQVNHTYTLWGYYKVKLKVTDNKGMEYELTKDISIMDLEKDRIEIVVTPDRIQNLIREDEYIDPLDGLPGKRLYRVYTKLEGVYLPDEKVNVYLYKNGKQIKDLGTVTTQFTEKGVPVGYFTFDYKNPSYLGNYELVFTHGDHTARRAIKITDQRKKQDLWIQPVNALSGEVVRIYHGLLFDIDGIEYYGTRKQDADTSEFYYVITDVPTGFHKIKLLKQEFTGHSSEVMDYWHTSTEERVLLPVQAHSPGITRVWGNLETGKGSIEISSNMKDYKSFIYIPGGSGEPPIRFHIDVDWGDVSPGLFEIQYNGWTEKILNPWFDFVPTELYSGSKLLVRAVNPMGDASPWVDCKIAVTDIPTNPYVWLTYVDGEYEAETDIVFADNRAGQISGLNNMPLMDHDESFGIGDYYEVSYGKVKESNGKLLLNMSSSLEGSYGRTKKKPKMVSVGYVIEAEQKSDVYLIYDPEVGNWSVVTGEFSIWGDFSVFREKGKVIPIIDLGAQGRITIGTGFEGTLYIDNSTDALSQYSGILTLKPYAKGEIYGGIKGFNVEGYVEGSVESQIHIPTGYIQVVPELKANITNTVLFVKSTVFDETYTTSWNNGKTPVTPPKRLGLHAFTPDLSEENDSYEVIPRNYIQKDTEWLAPSHNRMMMKAADEDTTLIKNNIYPYADVQLIKRGHELVAVWMDDNEKRTDLNRTQLFTSTKTGTAWSSPVNLDQDGSADFVPAVTTTDTDVLIAWQDFNGIFTEEDPLEDIFKKSEISVTGKLYNQDEEDDFASLTKDDSYDHSPVIASIGNQSAMTVWIKSDNYKAPQGEEGTDRLMYSVWDGSNWSESTALEENMALIADCSLIAGDNSYLVLYTQDFDNDVTTPEDNEVWARIFDTSSNTWGAPLRLTENNIQDSNAQGVFYKGDWFITWYQEDRYVYRHGLTGETLTTESLAGVTGKMTLTLGDTFLALVYQKGGENNNRNLSTLFYDLEKGIWSHEIPLTSEPGYVRSFSPAFDSDGKLSVLYTQADIITEVRGGTEYYVPGNNVRLMFSTYIPKHDLAMNEKDAITIAENPIPETAVHVTCLVENKGDFAEMATVALYDGTPEKGVKIGEVIVEQPIPARSSIPVTLEWLVPAGEKAEYNLVAEVKSTEGVVETDYANNTANLLVSMSDAELMDVQWESLAGYEYLVKPLIFNNGSTPLESIKVVLSHNEREVASTVIKKLDPGEHANTSFIISSEGLSAASTGRYPMTVTVSLPEGVIENSLENNVAGFECDTRIITVNAMNPGDGQQQVGIKEPITMKFNRLITEKEGYDAIKLTDRYLNSIPVTKAIDQNVLTITPVNSLRHSTQYTLVIPEDAIGDSYGRSMKNSESISFTTVSENPVPVFSFPFDKVENIETDTEIRIQYSEVIKAGSTFNDIYLEQDMSNLKIPVTVTINEEWLTLRPTRRLAGNTAHSVYIPRGAVKNISEYYQSVDYDFIFTTKTDSENPIEEPGSDSGSGVKPPNPGELSFTSVHVDSLILNNLSLDQDGFYTLDLTQEANLLDGVRVSLSINVLNQLLTAGSGLRITTEKGELTFPEQWIKTHTENEKQSIIITIGERKENNQNEPDDQNRVSGHLNITVTVGGRPLIEFEDPITVVIPVYLEDIQNGQRVIACRYDELTGRWVPLGGKADMDAGTITFRTGHFSDFAAFETVRSFGDVIATWAKEPVDILASRGLINGKGEGVFDPMSHITRAEFTAIVIRSLYVKPVIERGTFTDVDLDAWYSENVETAAALGIMNGMGDGCFAPLENMTREQLAVIAYRLIGRRSEQKPQETTDHGFLDQEDIAAYAREGVNDLASKGIMIGSFGKFDPKASVTRQEAAVVLYRLLHHLGEI